ncbi:MAG: serine/threonine protein kinase [Candidatus Sumerlaeaceae bacterium]|nr:serine/threonine protein kinase [Candidatus Sumerlaeaceae bacterium]
MSTPVGPEEISFLSDRSKPVILAGHEVLRELGSGGMGRVWLARDPKLDRLVAIKLLNKELLEIEDAVVRFNREARAVAQLNHPNVVHIYQFGQENDLLFFIMEYVDGESLGDRLRREGALPFHSARQLMVQMAAGLGYAHQNGVIHRDVKPANVMISKQGIAKITDFGLAKMADTDSITTTAGVAMGSPSYMSPEAARGEVLDHRSDIYSLGITFYQTLTGRLPHTAPTPASVLLKQIQEPLPEPELLRDLCGGAVLEIIKRMTAKHPDERYPNYETILAELAAVPDSSISGVRPVTPYSQTAIGTFSAGAAVIPSPLPAFPSATMTAPPAPQPKEQQHRRNTRKWMLIAGGAFLVGAGVSAFVITDMVRRNRNGAQTINMAAASLTPAPTSVPGQSSQIPPNGQPLATEGSQQRRPGLLGRRGDGPLRSGAQVAANQLRSEIAPELTGLLQTYDFEEAANRLTQMLKEPNVPPPRQQAGTKLLQTLKELKGLRDAITLEASKVGARATLKTEEFGPLTLKSAGIESFTFDDSKGNTHILKWDNLRPADVRSLGEQLLPPSLSQQSLAIFDRVYTKVIPPSEQPGGTQPPEPQFKPPVNPGRTD